MGWLFLMWMVVKRTIPTSSLRPPQPIMCIQGSPKLIAIRRSDKATMLGKSSGPDSSSGIWTKTTGSLNLHHFWVARISQFLRPAEIMEQHDNSLNIYEHFTLRARCFRQYGFPNFYGWCSSCLVQRSTHTTLRGSTPFKFSSGRKLQSGQIISITNLKQANVLRTIVILLSR